MRAIDIAVIFLSLFVVLGGLSIPLWWNYASPFIFRFPQYAEGVIRNIMDLVELVLKSV